MNPDDRTRRRAVSEQFFGMVDYLLAVGEERGLVKGEERGIAIVNERNDAIEIERRIVLDKLEVARNMKESGYPFDAIVAAVNLDPQIVRRWLYESEDE